MTKKHIIFAFLFCFLCFNSYAQKNQNQKAIDSITKLINTCTNCSHYYYNRAELNLEVGNQMEAMSDLNVAIEIHIKYFDKRSLTLTKYYLERAKLKLDLKDYRGGTLDFEKATEVGIGTSSIWTEVYFGRAFCKAKLGDYEGAIADYEKVFIHSPDDKLTHYNLGLIKIDLEKKDEGCLHLSKSGELGLSEAYKAISKYCN